MKTSSPTRLTFDRDATFSRKLDGSAAVTRTPRTVATVSRPSRFALLLAVLAG